MLLFRISIILSFFCFSSCEKTDAVNKDKPPVSYTKQTIQYKILPNTDANLLSLDVYSYTHTNPLKPIIIYVHGGGWSTGDKTNKLNNKLALFNSLDYIFVSVNYRLSPTVLDLSNTHRIKYPDHNQDVADAVKWVIDNIGRYGGDPEKIVLLGHSAGAHLVSLTGSSQLFLPARNIPLSSIRGIASIDTEGYDITSQSKEAMYQNAFGTDKDVQLMASPLYNLTNSHKYPSFFVAIRGSASRISLANNFINKLASVRVPVRQVNGSLYDHEGINNAIGDPSDTVVTPALIAFLNDCFN